MEKNLDNEDIKKKLLSLWIDDIRFCSQCFGTEYYVKAWQRFENDIVDVPGVAPFKQLMDTKKKQLSEKGKGLLDGWCKQFPFESKSIEKEFQDDEIKEVLCQELCNYMLGVIMEKMFL